MPAAGALVLAVFCSGLAGIRGIAAPVVDVDNEDTRPDLILLVDSSKSMYAADVAPSRLHEALRQLNGVVRDAPASRIGIVTFAGDVSVVCPLTADRDAAAEALASVENAPAGGRGSALAPALDRAIEAFGTSNGEHRILLVSDGEDTGSSLEPTIARFRDRKVPIDAIGVGTPGGAPVPTAPGSSEFQADPSQTGRPAMTALNESLLVNMSSQTGGTYRRLSVQEPELAQRLAPIWTDPVPRTLSVAANPTQLLLFISFVLLALDGALRALVSRLRFSR